MLLVDEGCWGGCCCNVVCDVQCIFHHNSICFVFEQHNIVINPRWSWFFLVQLAARWRPPIWSHFRFTMAVVDFEIGIKSRLVGGWFVGDVWLGWNNLVVVIVVVGLKACWTDYLPSLWTLRSCQCDGQQSCCVDQPLDYLSVIVVQVINHWGVGWGISKSTHDDSIGPCSQLIHRIPWY